MLDTISFENVYPLSKPLSGLFFALFLSYYSQSIKPEEVWTLQRHDF